MIRNTILIFLTAFLLTIACTSVPVTGRRQLKLVGDNTLMQMSFQQYNSFLRENKISTNQQQTAMVKRVGNRIQKAVEKYMAQKGMSDKLDGFAWEFNLVEDNQLNAWCMPGGKVVVYTGILPACKTETGLAVVMGHEIAHAIAQHGNERMSQGIMQQLGGVALNVALMNKSEEARALWMAAYGAGSQVGMMLPFSRKQESEADEIGLTFSAMAGYDPREAPEFWERMQSASGGNAPPEFLSTHPSSATRIKNLTALIPQVMPLYRQAMAN